MKRRTATREIEVDYFAGGGGASLGIAQATGRAPSVAVNHDAAAIAMHRANHRQTKHFTDDVFRLSPRVATAGRPVGLFWASPDCKHFSRAKGGKPVEKKIRGLAWAAIRFAAQEGPRIIVLENVREFEDWGPLLPRWDCAACGWKGTEGQATLLRKRRACPSCESKALKESRNTDTGLPYLVPDPTRKGLTFRQFVGRLKALGYHVEWKVLNAADYGAPTHRRRLFLIGRNDGEKIVWPDPTHGDPKKIGKDLFSGKLVPWRTAAECIDWSIPCPSIFERKTPLRPNTLRRIAMGIKRYVLDNPRPFIVGVGGRAGQSPATSADAPAGTVTAKNDRAVVTPMVVPVTHQGKRRVHPPTEPLPTVTGANRGELSLVAPVISRIGQTGGNGSYATGIGDPVTTITSKAEHLLLAPTLVQTGYGERKGQKPRTLDIEAPLGTVVGGGTKHALVSAFIAKHYGGVVGCPADTPLPTTTARGTQNQCVAANLIRMNHGEKQWNGADEPHVTVTTGGHSGLIATNLVHLNNNTNPASVEDPLHTITGGGNHAALVYSFLIKYFGVGVGQLVDDPLHTVTGKDRFGLVTVTIDGQPYAIVDIGMRMLRPRELARAQGFPDDYVLTGTATNQVERIGNSVCPPVARAIVAANYRPRMVKPVERRAVA